MENEEVTLRVSRSDVPRILSGLRDRLKKAERGIQKFGDDFDPELGASMLSVQKTHQSLIHRIQEQL